jgi:site-specific DNA recombinase
MKHEILTNKNKPTAYCIYVRKSTESEDRQVLSIPAQLDELGKLSKEKFLCLDGSPRSESKSAKAPGRPIFAKMMQDIQEGEIQGIVCWKLDRLARNPVDGGALIWALDQGKLKEIITPTRTFTNTGDDKFWMQLEFGMAKKYVDDLSVNVKRGIKKKLEDGGLPGKAPIGYLNDRLNKTVIKDTERFPLIRRMWDLLISGQYSVKRIHDIAVEQWGFRTPRSRNIGGGPMQLSRTYYLFTNPFYCGLILREGKLLRGKHEPMITANEFERAQTILNRSERHKPEEQDFPFTGLIRCAKCERMITAETHIKKSGKMYTYYHCTNRKTPCSKVYIRAEKLEMQFGGFIEKLGLTSPYCDWLLEQYENDKKFSEAAREVQIDAIKRQVQSTERKMSVLTGLRISEEVSPEDYRTQYNHLLQDQVRLEEKLYEFEKKGNRTSELVNKALSFLKLAKNYYQCGKNEQKRKILWIFGLNPRLEDGKLLISATKPFQLVLERSQVSDWQGR